MVRSGSAVDRPEHLEAELRARTQSSTGGIIIVERREFVRGCLTGWLARVCGFHLIAAVGDVEFTPVASPASRCVAAVIGMSGQDRYDWLGRQIGTLRSSYPALPIMLIIDTEQVSKIAELATRLDLQGYIPEFTSPEVAAAAVHLIIAGGCYFPRSLTDDLLPGRDRPPSNLAAVESLTSRQRLVLALLGSGMPNKMIAQQLGMSLSTVKVHVHHIIRKLEVGNRTEVALVAQRLANRTDLAITEPAPMSTC
jgi:DNA-binding NarL/FixJ family response regulator